MARSIGKSSSRGCKQRPTILLREPDSGSIGVSAYRQQMNEQEIAALVESTEARAYASLVSSSAASELDATATVVGSATVLRASKVRTPLVLNRTIGLGVGVEAREEDLEEIDALYREKELSYAIELSPCANPPGLPGWLRARRVRRTISA